MIDKYGVTLEIGMLVAAATLSYKSSTLRIGEITKLHDSGRISIRNDDGSTSVLHGPSQLVVISGVVGRKHSKT